MQNNCLFEDPILKFLTSKQCSSICSTFTYPRHNERLPSPAFFLIPFNLNSPAGNNAITLMFTWRMES